MTLAHPRVWWTRARDGRGLCMLLRAWMPAGLLAIGCLACRQQPSSGRVPVAADTLRGVVQIVGAEPLVAVQLRLVSGRVVGLEGGTPSGWRAASQLEVMVEGSGDAATSSFRAVRYTVRAVDGMPAVDGRLMMVAPMTFALRRADGTQLPLREVPPTLSRLAGARIYWVGPLDRAPVAYGVLETP